MVFLGCELGNREIVVAGVLPEFAVYGERKSVSRVAEIEMDRNIVEAVEAEKDQAKP